MRALLVWTFIGFATLSQAGELPPIEIVSQDLKDPYTVAGSSLAGVGAHFFALVFAVAIIAQLD